jgi:flavin reductase (DIM6/NTAB) family NADH-FMN oxidoreductase RutF
MPIFDDVIAWIDCDLESVDEAGDHWWVLGRVIQLETNHAGPPLVFFRGTYARVAV